MKKMSIAVAALAVSTAQAGVVIYVDAVNCPGPGVGSELDPYCSIQAAIDNAVDTDEIVVAPGTYVENINLLGKAVTVYSTGGPAITTIAANNPGSGPGFVFPTALTLDAANNRALVVDSTLDALLGADLTTGARTIISDPSTGAGTIISNAEGVDLDTVSNRALVINRVSPPGLYGVDLVTGDRTLISGSGPIFQQIEAVQFDAANNRALITDSGLNAVFGVNLATGARTVLSSPTVGTGPNTQAAQDIEYNPATNLAYVFAYLTFTTTPAVYLIDLNTGNRSILSDITHGTGTDFLFAGGLALNVAGNEVFALDPSLHAVISVDMTTGNRTIVSQNDVLGLGINFSSPTDVEYDAANNRVLVVDPNLDALIGVDLATGDRDVISQLFGGSVVDCKSGEGPDTILDGFTVTGALLGGGMRVDNASTPTVTNCIFAGNNSTTNGGAIVTLGASYPTVTDCIFVGNTAGSSGGAVSNGAGVSLANCTFVGNSSNFGGALFNPINVTNCVIIGNTATSSGGGIYESGFTTVTGCIVRENTPNQINLVGGSVTFSNVQGFIPGTGNIDADPLFADPDGPDNIPDNVDDDFHLLAGSPCIDAGDNSAPDLPASDIDGEPRIQQCRADIGIDESPLFGADCNNNGAGDSCDIQNGASLDITGTGIPDECEGFPAYNITQDTLHPSIAAAIAAANPFDEIVAPPLAFDTELTIDFDGTVITLRGTVGIDQPAGGLMIMADDATLASYPGQTLSFGGELRIESGDQANISTDAVLVGPTGTLSVQLAASADVNAAAGISNSGGISVFGTLLSSGGIHNEATGTMTTSGFVAADVTNDNQATFNGDSYVIGDYLNNGTIDINDGTLTIFGTLTDNGTITGTVAGGAGAAAGPGDDLGLAISGDLVLGASAALHMPSPQLGVRVEGNYDVAIDDNTRYDMVQAELRMLGAGPQSLEVMSLDIGPDPAGLDRYQPGHYPIGTLRIGPTRTTVDMVDNHDNDALGQLACEAIYVETLVVEPGALFNTFGCPVYYVTAQINGVVDDPANLIGMAPACPWNCGRDNDGNVGIVDFLALLSQWGGPGPCDFDGGGVGITDFLALLANWGPCP